jgi:hypothetical protein
MPLGSNTASRSSSGSSAKSKKNVPTKWLRILYWLLVAAGVYFAFLNISPYARAVSFLGTQAIDEAFIKLVSVIPIINGIASIFGMGITWLLGLILWGIVQIIELLPIILYNHEGFMATVIGQADTRARYTEKETDDPTLKQMKRIYNAMPTSMIRNLERLRIGVYVLDFLICFTVYSPVASGKITDFFWIIATGQWGQINVGNLLLAAITLFAVELIVSLIIWVGKLAYNYNESTK